MVDVLNKEQMKSSENTYRLGYIDEVLQDIAMLLSTKIGSFYPNKNYGSRLLLSNDINAENALTFGREALNSFDGVFVLNSNISGGNIIFDIYINNEERQVSVKYENNI